MENNEREALAAQTLAGIEKLEKMLMGADEALLGKPDAVGDWSVRDLLSHMVFWHNECLWAIESTLRGTYERRDYSDVDAVNARAVEQMAAVGAPELVEKLISTGREIAARTQEIPEDVWAAKARLKAWVHRTTVHHYQDHEADIRTALAETNT